jgi:hypothetical protein
LVLRQIIMRIRSLLKLASLAVLLGPTCALGQQRIAQVVWLRVGHACGMCSGSYSESWITIDSATIATTTIKRGQEDTLEHRPTTHRRRVSPLDWYNLRRFVDSTTLAGFVGRLGCPGCVDMPVDRVEVRLSDGTSKSVEFDLGTGPPAIQKLIMFVDAIAR